MKFRTLLTILLLGSFSNTHAVRYHVSATATGNGNGLSWTNAMTDLQEALSIVIFGDEIWVASGQYKPTAGTTRTISFALRNGVNIYGGFAGTETSLDQRDIASNPTVLNGDIGNIGESSDNSHRIVTAINITTSIILDGFRIMNGYSSSGSGYSGAGLNVQNGLSGNLLIRNCSFLSNYSGSSGGAIYMAAANVTIDNCDFINNQAGTGGDGGAIYNGNNNGGYSPLEIRNSRFRNNTARRGACIYGGLDFNPLLIDRCVFTNNTGEFSILFFSGFNSARMQNSYVIGNTVSGSGSNVLLIQTSTSGEVFTMSNCTFAQNYCLTSSPSSEIIRVYGSNHRINNSIVYGNTVVNGRQMSTGMGVANSIVQGGHAGGTNIINQDPLFMAPSAANNMNFDATLFDYTLQPNSPGINVGNNALVNANSLFDLNGDQRIQGTVVDLGCYESSLSVGTAELGTPGTRQLYFDPVHHELRSLDTEALLNKSYRIHDVAGRLQQQGLITGNTLKLDLVPGIHIVRLEGLAPLKIVVE